LTSRSVVEKRFLCGQELLFNSRMALVEVTVRQRVDHPFH
jgi:hypothetical protein